MAKSEMQWWPSFSIVEKCRFSTEESQMTNNNAHNDNDDDGDATRNSNSN